MTTHKIVASEVVRDKYGFWNHPDLPGFDEGDDDEFRDWIRDSEIEVKLVQMESDDAAEAVFDRYCAGDGNIAEWNPIAPDGYGWFLLCIFDHDDGPCAYFARQSTGATIAASTPKEEK